jgi:hypothetical protein
MKSENIQYSDCRIALCKESKQVWIRVGLDLTKCSCVCQLDYVDMVRYSNVLSSEQIRNMFILGVTHRPGFLANSYELTGPVHIPDLSERLR